MIMSKQNRKYSIQPCKVKTFQLQILIELQNLYHFIISMVTTFCKWHIFKTMLCNALLCMRYLKNCNACILGWLVHHKKYKHDLLYAIANSLQILTAHEEMVKNYCPQGEIQPWPAGLGVWIVGQGWIWQREQ